MKNRVGSITCAWCGSEHAEVGSDKGEKLYVVCDCGQHFLRTHRGQRIIRERMTWDNAPESKPKPAAAPKPKAAAAPKPKKPAADSVSGSSSSGPPEPPPEQPVPEPKKSAAPDPAPEPKQKSRSTLLG